MNRPIYQPSSKQPVLLQVLPALESGGVERGTIEIAAAAVKAGMRCIVASQGGGMVRQLYDVGASHVSLPLASKNPITIRKNTKRLMRIIEDQHVSIVHARSRAPAWSAYHATQKLNIPFVTTFHGTYSFNGNFKKRYNSVMVKGDRIIAISDFIREHMLANYEVDESKIRLIHRGVDLTYFDTSNINKHRMTSPSSDLKIDDSKPVIVLPGRITRWKGQSFLVEALKALPHRNFQCFIVGDDKKKGSFKKELEQQIKDYGLEPNIQMVGHVNDMLALYNLSDLIVAPSTDPEAFGRIAIEAQAIGRPFIGTNHGGYAESVRHGKTGWLVEPHDVTALTNAIETALNLSEEERDSLAKAQRRHVKKHFSLELMCDKTIAVYHELLAEKQQEHALEKEEALAS